MIDTYYFNCFILILEKVLVGADLIGKQVLLQWNHMILPDTNMKFNLDMFGKIYAAWLVLNSIFENTRT